MVRLLLGVFTAALALGATARLPSVDARYTLTRGPLTIGTAESSLQALGGDCYRYAYSARPRGVARMFIGEVAEVSEFCLVNDEFQPRFYSFTRADKPSENYVLHFDLAKGEARTEDGRVQTFEGPVTDRLSLQLKVQRWVMQRRGIPSEEEFSVTQVEDDRIRTYRFRIMAREALEIGGRTIDTVRVERVDSDRRSIRIWAAVADDWRIVRVEHIERGSVQFRMQID